MSYNTDLAALSPTYWWKLAETSGTTAADSADTNAGTYTNSPTLNQSGAARTGTPSVSFLYSSSQYVPTATSLSSPGSTGFSIVLWFNTANGGIQGFFSRSSATPPSGSYDQQIYLDSNNKITAGQYDGSTEQVIESNSTVNDGNWHMVAFTWQDTGGNSGPQRLYIDGTEQSASPHTSGGPQSFSGVFEIGAFNGSFWPNISGGTNQYANGNLQQVAYWDGTVLTAANVKTLWSGVTGIARRSGYHKPIRSKIFVPKHYGTRHHPALLAKIPLHHYYKAPHSQILIRKHYRTEYRSIMPPTWVQLFLDRPPHRSRYKPRPRLPFKVRKERWQRYPIGMPFVRLAHAARRFIPKPRIPFKVHKERWQRYPIGMPFVRLAHAARHFVPKPKVPFKVRKERWLRNPIATSSIRLAHATRQFISKPKIPFKVRKARWSHYPVVPYLVGRSQSNQNSSGANLNITTPTGTTSGDMMVLVVASFSVVPTGPSGWTALGTNSDTSGDYIGAWAMKATGTATYTVTGDFPKAILRVYRGPTSVDSSASSGTSTIPALSATSAANDVYAGFFINALSTIIPPSDLSNGTPDNTQWFSWDGEKIIAASGTVPGAETVSSTGRDISFGVTLTTLAGTAVHAPRRFVPRPKIPFRVRKERWVRSPIAPAFVRLAHAVHRFVPRSKIPFKVRKEYWVRYPILRLAHAARNFIPRPKIPFKVRKERWLRYPIGMPFVRLAHAARRFVPKPKVPFKVRKERWLRYPIGMPFVRLAHAARRFIPRPKVPFKVRKEHWLRYPIGMPFVRLAHAARRFIPKPRLPFRVRKALWIRYPVVPIFVHLAHTVHRFIPRPKVPFKVRKERWIRNPSGFPFIRLAHAARHFVPRPKIPFKVGRARWLRYPIGMPFVRLAHATRRFIPRPKLPFRVRKERWLRYAIGLPFVRIARAGRHFIPKPRISFAVRKSRWLRYPTGLPFVRLAHAIRHFLRPAPKQRIVTTQHHRLVREFLLTQIHRPRKTRNALQPITARIGKTAHKIRALTTIPLAFFRRENVRRKPYPWQRPFRWRRQWRDLGIRIPAADAPRIIFAATLDRAIVFEATLDQAIVFAATLNQAIVLPASMS